MAYEEPMILELLVCLGILCLFVIDPWLRRTASVGLPLCYLLSLAIIHWLGAFIHVLPWNSVRDPYTYNGFHQTFLAGLAFTTGSILLAPFVLRMILPDAPGRLLLERVGTNELRLPETYMFLGMSFYALLAPAVASIPSVAAVTVTGVYLTVVGLCLACWRAHIDRSRLKLLWWLSIVCFIPFLTVVTLGFIGYGALASLLVFTFVATYYQPRWQVAAGLGLLMFLGLSLFVTYARDRNTLREAVWGGATYTYRMETLVRTLTDFELINFRDARHLKFIDRRLNQNFLVGRAVETIDQGREQYAKGETLYEAFLALVPRIIWPDKPVRAGSPEIVSHFTRMSFAAGTSVGIGQVMELYIDFGTTGIIGGFLIIGVLIRVLDTIAALRLREGNWQGFMSWFLPSISLLNVGGSLVEVFGTAAASVVLVTTVNKMLAYGLIRSNHTGRSIPLRSSTQILPPGRMAKQIQRDFSQSPRQVD